VSDDDKDAPMGEEYPQFRTVLRGYDPSQVEEVLDDLYASLEDAVKYAEESAADADKWRRAHGDATASLDGAKQRIAELEKNPGGSGPATYESLGTRIAQILETANAEAADIRQRAAVEAQSRNDESQAAAVATRAETDHYATQIRERAESEAARIVEDAQAKAREILSEAEALLEQHRKAATEAQEDLNRSLGERRTEAEERLAEIQARVDAMEQELRGARERAEADAAAIRQSARDEAGRLLADAQAQSGRVQQEAARRHEEAFAHRARVRAQLAEVRRQLSAVSGAAPPGEAQQVGPPERSEAPVSSGAGSVLRALAPKAVRRSPRREPSQPVREAVPEAAPEPQFAEAEERSSAADNTTEVLPADDAGDQPAAPRGEAQAETLTLPAAEPAQERRVVDPRPAGPTRSRVSEPLQWAPQETEQPSNGAARTDEGAEDEDFDDSFQGEAWDREEAAAHRT
jgi:cell division septum initiation protein DivIVA